MINLLPGDEKKQFRAGRSNLLLIRYNLALGAVVLVLIAAMGYTYYYLSSVKTASEQTILDNTTKEQSYINVKTSSDTFKSQLAEAKQLFDSQISYSKAVLTIAKLVPSGAVVTNIKLDATSFTTPLILSAKVKGETEALKLKENFQQSNDFSNVSFGKLTKGEGEYPYAIDLNISMKRELIQ